MKIKDVKVGDRIYKIAVNNIYDAWTSKYIKSGEIIAVGVVKKKNKNRLQFEDGTVLLCSSGTLRYTYSKPSDDIKFELATVELDNLYELQQKIKNMQNRLSYEVMVKHVSLSDLEQINSILSKYE